MGMFDWLFPDPSKKAHKYLDKVPGQITPYYDPYIQAGRGALDTSQGEYNKLLQNPGGWLNQIGGGYQQSPGFQAALDRALQGAGHAQAAGGMAGSPQHEYQNMQIATDLANQDYNQWLQNALGLYGAGLGGMGGLTQLGYGASNELAQSLAQNLMNKAGLGYANQVNQNQMTGGILGNLSALFPGNGGGMGGMGGMGGGASGGLNGIGQNLAQYGADAAMFI